MPSIETQQSYRTDNIELYDGGTRANYGGVVLILSVVGVLVYTALNGIDDKVIWEQLLNDANINIVGIGRCIAESRGQDKQARQCVVVAWRPFKG